MNDAQLTNAFIEAGIARDGYLYSYARKIIQLGKLNVLSPRERAYVGMSHWPHFYNYTKKLEKAGIVSCEYDAHGDMVYVHSLAT